LLYFPYVVLHTTMVGTIKIFGWEGIKGWIPYNALLLILFALNVRGAPRHRHRRRGRGGEEGDS
jgi:hypothetical protein